MDTQEFNQEQETISRQNQEFWNKWYSQFKQGTPAAVTPTSAPGFDQAAQRTQDYAQTQMVAPNSVDVGGMNRDIQNKMKFQSRSSDMNSFLRDLEENRGRSQRLGSLDFNRMQDIQGANQRVGRLPMDRLGRQLQTDEDIMSMWDAYRSGIDPAENLIGSAVGGLGGQLTADLFGRNKRYPSQDDRPGEQYGPAF